MMSLWDALRMNMMISYQELVRTFPSSPIAIQMTLPPERQFAISELNLFSSDAQLSVFISTIRTPEKNLTGSRFDVFECFSGLYFDRTLRQIKLSFFFRASDVIFIFFIT
ncbi:hypothetical protein ACOXDF_28070 (plasmid) [Klebsiella pneumoniae]|uniref:hypothetical protein n=1 Tax=Klebsiella pneumoniae TaxID=573 RepID=UPI001E59FCB6|nr:hypothetical protein [Klebsiella pneumoniae]